MSFDWGSFARGFAERTLEKRSEREAEARQYEEDQRRAAERNAATLSRRRLLADRVTGYANYLQQNGFSEAQLQAVISSGPDAMRTIVEQVQTEVQRNNNRPLGSSDVETMLNMPAGFQSVEMPIEEFISTSLNLNVPAAQPSQGEEFGFMDRLFGRDARARADERLANAPGYEGMSIAQVNAAAQRADFESVIPGTFVTFAGAGYEYDVTEEGVDFLRDSNRILDQLEASPQYSPVSIQQAAGEEQLSMDQIEEIQTEMRANAIDSLIRGYAERDPEGFMNAHEDQLRIRLGDAYVDQLRLDLGLDAPEPEEGEATTGGGTETGMPTDVLGDTILPASEAPDAMTEIAAPVAPRADTVDFAEPQEEETSEPDPETTVQVEEGDTYTYAQWQNMTREERRDAGLPLGEGEAQIYFNRFGAGIGEFTPIEDLVGPAGEGNAEQRRIYEELSSQGVDDTSIALLQTHGSDMRDYVVSKDATTQAEIFMALTEWGQENNIVMPFDKAALVVAMQSAMNNE